MGDGQAKGDSPLKQVRHPGFGFLFSFCFGLNKAVCLALPCLNWFVVGCALIVGYLMRG